MCFMTDCMSSDSSNECLFKFSDALQTPEQFHREDYVAHHKRKGTPIVIDNGINKTKLDCT